MTAATASDLLVIVIDCQPLAWAQSATTYGGLSLQEAVDNLVVFSNAHLALRDENQLAVYAATESDGRLLYTSLQKGSSEGIGRELDADDANTYSQFRLVDRLIYEGVRELIGEEIPNGKGRMGIVQAMAKALAHINKRVTNADVKQPADARILVISATDDTSSQYIPMMNCIFSAQKSSIPIDVCKVFGRDTVVLQQASHLTAGAYLKLDTPNGLLQYLMMSFMPGKAMRKQLIIPTLDQVDLRAACFCHRRIIDVGHVCSVCLSIFCAPVKKCTTCKTPFSAQTQPGKRPRPSRLSQNNGHADAPQANGNGANGDVPNQIVID